MAEEGRRQLIFEGQQILSSDLRLTIFSNNVPIVATTVLYDIKQGVTSYLSGTAVLDTGSNAYYPAVTLPAGLSGSTDIAWTVTSTDGSTYTPIQTFIIYTNNMLSLSTEIFTGKTKEFITLLRYGLRDFSPDVHYRFNPVLDPERNYTDNYKQSVIWDDRELYYYLYLALADVNSKPPLTKYFFETLPAQYYQAFLTSAKYQACYAKALNWAAEDYVFNVGSNSVNIERQTKYTQMAEAYYNQYQALIEQTKKATEKFCTIRGKYQ